MAMNPEWEIHWTLTGQTHLYGWVDIDGLRCRVTMSRREQGGRVEVGLGTDPPRWHLHRRAGVPCSYRSNWPRTSTAIWMLRVLPPRAS